ncbi:MAG: BNR-4 repeat-containing protein [Verrucomicrobiota bacterium]
MPQPFRKFYALFPVLCMVGTAHADLTYVDAVDGAAGNTSLSNGSVLLADDSSGATTWRQRDGATLGSAATVFEGVDVEPEIRTRITGLSAGASYRIYVHFLEKTASTSEKWNVRAGFTSGNLTLFGDAADAIPGATSAVLSSSFSYAGAQPLFTGTGTSLAGLVGTATANASGEIDVFVGSYGSGAVNYRTWYDGVSHEPAVATNDVTYVDAAEGNTARRDGLPFVPAAQGNVVIDDNWETRTLGTNDTVFESNADGPEDAPLLVTTLTGLAPSTSYVLYAYFWHDGRNWRLKATADVADINDNGTPAILADDFLPTHPLTNFASTGNAGGSATFAGLASATTYVTAPELTEGNRILRQAVLGTATSDSTGNLSFYIDDLAGAGEGDRVWFDGVGYKLALPLAPSADEDDDGLTNGDEETRGTDPYLVDTDGDTFSDAIEVAKNSNPLDANSVPPLPGNAVAIAPDGAWTWFNDERTIIHQGSMFCGYVKSNGQYGVTRYNLSNGQASHMIISTSNSQQQDDHNNPSITVLPDGKLMILYSKHIAGAVFYQRISTVPLPTTSADWGPEITVPVPANNTYANTYLLSAESNAIYNFSRCINFNPTLSLSTNQGASWQPARQLVGTGSGNTRPYPRYTSNGVDRIDLIYTDGHPRDVENSVYHMYYKNGGLHKTDGTLIDSLANIPLDHDAGQRGNVVYAYSNDAWGPNDGPDDWIPTGRGWTWDVSYGQGGNPVCAFQVQVDNAVASGAIRDRIYYYYARWTGTAWQRRFIAQAGRPLYAAEDDYGGGMCLDPADPRVVYISSNAASPFDLSSTSNVPLRANDRYEIWRGFTADGGLTFSWTQITVDSENDNLRPIVPMNHGLSECLVWFNGTYNTYTNFSARVLARIGAPQTSFKSWSEGYAVPPTSPSDSDFDGVDNLIEFALDGNPSAASSRPQPTLQGESFSFPWPEDRSGIEWIVQESGNLSSWNDVAVLRGNGLPSEIGPGFQLTTNGTERNAVLTPLGQPPLPRFLRLKVATTD